MVWVRKKRKESKWNEWKKYSFIQYIWKEAIIKEKKYGLEEIEKWLWQKKKEIIIKQKKKS